MARGVFSRPDAVLPLPVEEDAEEPDVDQHETMDVDRPETSLPCLQARVHNANSQGSSDIPIYAQGMSDEEARHSFLFALENIHIQHHAVKEDKPDYAG